MKRDSTDDLQQKFDAIVQEEGRFTFIEIPFSPRDVWGSRPRYHVTGTINGCPVRGCLGAQAQNYFLRLGQAWIRDNGHGPGSRVSVCLTLEGPQESNLSADILDALSSDKKAKSFFDGLPTFYRKNFVRWIESAKRPETREKRIREMMILLSAGKHQR